MISIEHKCIFVHIPKNAGTSIESVIWPEERSESQLWMGFVDKYHNKYQTGGLQHLLAKQIRQEVGEQIFSDFFKFTIVRNPWDKAVSQFSYMSKRKDLREFCRLSDSADFKTYLQAITKVKHVQWMPQVDFILDDEGNPLVDFIGRFESLDIDVSKIFNKLNITSTLPHINQGNRDSYHQFYDEESKGMVAELFSKDIAYFNYQF
ncbi:sulfotransferase family 2 domain-containing protein [Shewanella japonica]|uniref:sulfotransferase family 2 domain-containing protein n=1 Tax=Shewanella japonica TaxID=93973 RepID=UPI0024944909|nr:sulfotransferase family 2 domain-containing protein [Shewanella japonica]